MSAKLTGLVHEHLAEKPGVKIVAAILADHAGADGICWPSMQRLAAFAQLDQRSVRRYVARLIEIGVVTKLRNGTVVTLPGGRRIPITNAYRVNAHVLAAMPSLDPKLNRPDPVEFSTANLWKEDADVHLETDTHVRRSAKRRTPMSTKPSYEPSIDNRHADEPVDNFVSLGDVLGAIMDGEG